jgi:hypothetical protein
VVVKGEVVMIKWNLVEEIRNILLYVFAVTICMLSCDEGSKEYFSETPIRIPAPDKIYERDSIYLAYTIYMFSKLDVVGYGYGFQRADIDTIVYNSDTLKLFAFVIDSFYDAEEKEPAPYDGHAILGYRLKTTDPWVVYPVTFSVFVGYKNYNKVRDRLRKAYFQDLKYYVYSFWNQEKKGFVEYTFYNVTDSKFWDSCIIWQKDISIPGYYQFQISGNGDPEMIHAILEIPEINYPDSLLKLYG